MSEAITVTVSQLNRYLTLKLGVDPKLQGLYVKGEISNFVNHAKTGHFYFTLKEGDAAIRAVMFKGYTKELKFLPENGLGVIVRANVKIYERDGTCQLYAEEMQPDGIGALYLAFEQLKTRLAAEGLFDESRKRPLPPFPKRIAIVTAKTGAAIQDMLNILGRRYPLAEVVLIPALVQGKDAPASVCAGIAKAQGTQADILIVGRGGGSIEDLWAFNEETVARAIVGSAIPVISAVGHETDVTIADFAADLRAPTPSAAAELAVPDRTELLRSIAGTRERLASFEIALLRARMNELSRLYGRVAALSPQGTIKRHTVELSAARERLQARMGTILEGAKQRFSERIGVLDALSPLKVLLRGYAIASKGDTIVTDVSMLEEGDELRLRFGRGEATATVRDVFPADAQSGGAR